MLLAGLATLAGCASAGSGSAGHGTTSPDAVPVPGRVAVLSATGIEIVGEAAAERVGGSGALSPQWSPDGRTLGYLDGQRLWLADRSGRPHLLLERPIDSFSWSPVADVVAAVPVPHGAPGGLVVVNTAGQVTTLVGPDFYVDSYRWSPDGRTLAYSEALPAMSAGPANRTDRLYVRRLADPAPRLVPYDPGPGNGIILGPWWPDRSGIYLWPDPDHSSSIAADGLELQSVSLTDGHATGIGLTLPHPQTLSVSPDGARVVVMEGGSRFLTQTKRLVICAIGGPRCSAVPQPAGAVSVEASWAPDGKEIVFVRAAASQDVDTGAWLPTTRLYLYDLISGRAREIEGAPSSVGYPEFSPDGRDVIFQHGGDLLMVELASHRVRVLATGLPPLYAQWDGMPPYALAGDSR